MEMSILAGSSILQWRPILNCLSSNFTAGLLLQLLRLISDSGKEMQSRSQLRILPLSFGKVKRVTPGNGNLEMSSSTCSLNFACQISSRLEIGNCLKSQHRLCCPPNSRSFACTVLHGTILQSKHKLSFPIHSARPKHKYVYSFRTNKRKNQSVE